MRIHSARCYGAVSIRCFVRLWAVILCATFSCNINASANKEPSPPGGGSLHLSEYQKQDWQVEDGLPENNVRMITQRPDGSLLLATGSGLASFDGQRFRSLPVENGQIQNEAVNAVLYGRANDLWIGTDGRGVLHQTAQGLINISERAGRYNERIRMFYPDSAGVLWIATQNGVERYANNHLEVIPNTGMISGDITTPFAEDGSGGMFFVTSTGLYHWRDGVAMRYPLLADRTDLPVAVYRDPQQRLWLGTMKHVFQLTVSAAKEQGNSRRSGFTAVLRAKINNPVTVLLGDAKGNLWIGTRHRGLWRLSSGELSHWGMQEGLADESIRSMFLDDEQNLWIGMLDGGLSRWREGPLAPFGAPEGLNATYAANVLADSRGDLWLGTWGRGLYRRHHGRLQSFTPPGLRLTTQIRALAEDSKAHIWIGTWFDGIYRYDGHTFHHYLLGTESPGNAVSVILSDKHGGLWIGTYTGLFYFAAGEPDPKRRVELLNSQLVTSLMEDKDGSILAGSTSGLYRIRNNQSTPVPGFPAEHVLALFLDSKGYAWASTKTGRLIAVFPWGVLQIPANSGLQEYLVNTAAEDKDGHLWLGTSRGIVRVSVAEMHAAVDKGQASISTVILGKADGMRSSEISGLSSPSSTRTLDGTLWFATAKGFVHTTENAEKLGKTNPVVEITGWSLSNDINSANVAAPRGRIELEAGQPDLLILFNARFLANPDAVAYRYRLTGYDRDWTNTRGHSARYRRLPPGNYRFEVQARFNGEEWTSAIASQDIRQSPYFYQSWYTYLILALVIAGAVVFLFHRRVQTIKGRIGIVLEERNRIARECHDTLMAGFAAISWQLEATSKQLESSMPGQSAAAQSFELARSMVSHCQAEARRIIWDLRDMEDVTNALSLALRRTLVTNDTQNMIETSLEVEGEEPPLTPACVHHLLCIGQEAYFNAVRHAAASRIMIHLKYEGDALNLSIRDNGCGIQDSRSTGPRHGHFGMAVMEERARKLGGILKVQSHAGEGTEVMVRVAFSSMSMNANVRQPAIKVNGL
jgi:ligand-binding sensor domain-containing protein/signal transduction histidine kinase